MVIIQVCVGSSCHLRGAPQVVELFQKKVADQNLEGEVVLMGSFCAGKCNKIKRGTVFQTERLLQTVEEKFSPPFRVFHWRRNLVYVIL